MELRSFIEDLLWAKEKDYEPVDFDRVSKKRRYVPSLSGAAKPAVDRIISDEWKDKFGLYGSMIQELDVQEEESEDEEVVFLKREIERYQLELE